MGGISRILVGYELNQVIVYWRWWYCSHITRTLIESSNSIRNERVDDGQIMIDEVLSPICAVVLVKKLHCWWLLG